MVALVLVCWGAAVHTRVRSGHFAWKGEAGQACKEGVRGSPVRQMLDETMPLIHPVGAVAAPTLVPPIYARDGQVTRRVLAQGLPQGAPEGRIEEGFVHGNHDRGVIIGAGPGGVFVIRPAVIISGAS
jgi:hypothetical protein